MADRTNEQRNLPRYDNAFDKASGSRFMVEDEDGDWLRHEDVDALLHRINLLACYASEENTEARATALLEIGKLARLEMKA